MNAGLLAAAFAAVSPIELALGRRALQDEVFCLAVLAAFTVVVVAPKRIVLAVIAIAVALSIKESFLLLLPAFLVYKRRDAWLLLIPPARIRAVALFVSYALATMSIIPSKNLRFIVMLFYTIFIRGAVYDPVTQSILEAVGAVRRDHPAADQSMLFPWICAVVALFAWLQNQYAGRPASRMA